MCVRFTTQQKQDHLSRVVVPAPCHIFASTHTFTPWLPRARMFWPPPFSFGITNPILHLFLKCPELVVYYDQTQYFMVTVLSWDLLDACSSPWFSRKPLHSFVIAQLGKICLQVFF